jgi:endonuclease/exonuclease/phosphatase family metal-dependent hydrolase
MSYNLLNYPASGAAYADDTTQRHPSYRTIFQSVDADIIVVQELSSGNGLNEFHSTVINQNGAIYSMGPFLDGYDSDNGIFFKSAEFHSCTNKRIDTELRDINEFKLVHTLSGDTIRIYSVHLKASSGSSNEAQRAREIDSLRKVTNALPAGSNFIVCGDFNIYGSSESAYQKLLQDTPGNEGHFIDPVTLPGTWNQSTYSQYHTQSPRIRIFGGGAIGGLDDRFDMILFSSAVDQAGGIQYIDNSLQAYGNDGTLYNDSINHPSNSAVPANVANALHNASDHIPVLSQFTLEYSITSPPTDFSVLALTEPQSPMCSNSSQNMSVSVKNNGVLSVDFSVNPLEVHISVNTPSSGTLTFSETVNSGSIAAGASMSVSFGTSINMSSAGTYSFTSYTVQANDANNSNDTLSGVQVVVTSAIAVIMPAGPHSICYGDSIELSANSGISYLWSNGASSQSITVSDTGNYTVEVTLAGGCSSTSAPVLVSYNIPGSGGSFTESMGSVASTTAIATHESNNGFDNDSWTMSGTADIRNTSPSSGYSGASGLANVFFTGAGRFFIISGINTSGLNNVQLSHGIHKNQNAPDGTGLTVEYSTNGTDYTLLSPAAVATGSGSATWHYRNVGGTIPSSSSLSLRFTSVPSGTEQYRIDDITLTGTAASATLTAGGPTTLCTGDSVTLTASSGTSYHWNTGASTQSITVNQSGDYYATVDCAPTDTVSVSVSNCTDVVLNLKLYIQGFFTGNQSMTAVADPVNYPSVCDSIRVELAESVSPYNPVHTQFSTINTNGEGVFVFPPSVFGNDYYIVVKHRNSLETWSSIPLAFDDTTLLYDFTTSAGQAFGNNLANVDGEFCLFSGDVSDGITSGVQDGLINMDDYQVMEDALLQFINTYHVSDLTGDWITETADFSLLENNILLNLSVQRP